MSSQPPESQGENPPPRIRWYNYWPKWRRIMLGGALLLLVGALVPAIVGEEDAPAWLGNATLIIGYGLLAYGFLLAMRARRTPSEAPPADEDERPPT